MSINRQRILWAAFLLATLLTRLVDSMLWRAKWQFSALEVLGTISIILGVAIVAPKGGALEGLHPKCEQVRGRRARRFARSLRGG